MQLIKDPDPILKQVAEPWDFATDQNLDQIEQEMIQIMKTFHGRGLAANQVGLLKRVLVIQLDNYPELLEPFIMVNPSIALVNDESSQIEGEEGCLSFPNLWIKVKRAKSVTVEYFDKSGKSCIIELSGIDARCFLHELDHLNGIVFTDHVSQMKLMLARKKQRKNNGRTK
jgi:peptide deformylase